MSQGAVMRPDDGRLSKLTEEQRRERRLATYARYRQTQGYRDSQERAKPNKIVQAAAWNKANPTRRLQTIRRSYLSKYGLTPDDYRDHIVGQAGRCAICCEVFPSDRETHADHDHATGKFRGFLCGKCNRMLGTARDKPSILRSAALFLERSRA